MEGRNAACCALFGLVCLFPLIFASISTPTNILIFGGNGFICGEVTAQLIAAKISPYQLAIVNRGSSRFDFESRIRPRVLHAKCDRSESLDNCETFHTLSTDNFDHHIHTVVDCSAYSLDPVQEAVTYFKKHNVQVDLYIYISTDSVYEVCKPTDKFSKEEDAVRPNDDEYAARLSNADPYGHNKLLAEEFLRGNKNPFPYLILRLPDVIGPRENPNRIIYYLNWLRLHSENVGMWKEFNLFVPERLESTKMSLVFVEDVAALITRIIQRSGSNHSGVLSNVYNLAFSEVVTLREFLELLSQVSRDILGFSSSVSVTDVVVPYWYPSVTQGPVDISKAKQKLSWTPTSLYEALEITVKFFEEYTHEEFITAELNKAFQELYRKCLSFWASLIALAFNLHLPNNIRMMELANKAESSNVVFMKSLGTLWSILDENSNGTIDISSLSPPTNNNAMPNNDSSTDDSYSAQLPEDVFMCLQRSSKNGQLTFEQFVQAARNSVEKQISPSKRSDGHKRQPSFTNYPAMGITAQRSAKTRIPSTDSATDYNNSESSDKNKIYRGSPTRNSERSLKSGVNKSPNRRRSGSRGHQPRRHTLDGGSLSPDTLRFAACLGEERTILESILHSAEQLCEVLTGRLQALDCDSRSLLTDQEYPVTVLALQDTEKRLSCLKSVQPLLYEWFTCLTSSFGEGEYSSWNRAASELSASSKTNIPTSAPFTTTSSIPPSTNLNAALSNVPSVASTSSASTVRQPPQSNGYSIIFAHSRASRTLARDHSLDGRILAKKGTSPPQRQPLALTKFEPTLRGRSMTRFNTVPANTASVFNHVQNQMENGRAAVNKNAVQVPVHPKAPVAPSTATHVSPAEERFNYRRSTSAVPFTDMGIYATVPAQRAHSRATAKPKTFAGTSPLGNLDNAVPIRPSDELVREQNKQLTGEVSSQHNRISQLEQEKALLIRELFQARTHHPRIAIGDESTFL